MIDLEAIRKRNEGRKNLDCGCTWLNGGLEENVTCKHVGGAEADIDALIAEVERLEAEANYPADVWCGGWHYHDDCVYQMAAMLAVKPTDDTGKPEDSR